ncbi:hypothetical protein V491_05958, partial [Pseudogymnoascus sp. VKM F-3775]
MAGSNVPEVKEAVTILVNYGLLRENRVMRSEVKGLKKADQKRGEEIRTLTEGVEQTLPTQLQLLDSTLRAAGEKHEAVIQTLKNELKTTQQTHAQDVTGVLKEADKKHDEGMQTLRDEVKAACKTNLEDLARSLKEADEKRGIENQLLRSGMEAVHRRYEEISGRLKALEDMRQDLYSKTITNHPHKRPRISLSIRQSQAHTTANDASLAAINTVPAAETGEGAPRSKPHPQAGASTIPEPGMDFSATIIYSTPTASDPVSGTNRLYDGRIKQGSLSLHDYTAAFARYVTSIRDANTNQSVNETGPAEREAMIQFMLGMRENRGRRRLVEDLEKAGLA